MSNGDSTIIKTKLKQESDAAPKKGRASSETRAAAATALAQSMAITTPPSSWNGFATLLFKEVRRFMRVAGQTLVSPLISTSLYLLIFGVNLADKISDQNGVNYLQFIIPGLVALGLLNNAFTNSSSSVIISKFHGDLQDLKIVPLTSGQVVWAYSLAGMFRGAIVGLAILLVGEAFYFAEYGVLLAVANPLLLLLFLLLGGITFAFVGLSVAIYADNFDKVNAVGTFVILPLIYLGGVFFSIESMNWFWKGVSHINPLLYLINGMRYAFLGVSDIQLSVSLPVSLLFVLVTYGLAIYTVRRGSYTRF